jgi:predicted DNA-binding transcriptional regulator AlpA
MERNHIEIRGADIIVKGLENCITHEILGNFERKMSGNKHKLDKLEQLQKEIDFFNDELRFPYGQLCGIERNLEAGTNIKLYYALKALPVLISIIDNEIYIQKMCQTMPEFDHLWATAKLVVNRWFTKLRAFEKGNATDITMSTLDKLISSKELKMFTETQKCFNAVKQAWQRVWTNFNEVREALDTIINQTSSEFDLAISDKEPPRVKRDYFFLGIDENRHVRLFAMVNDKKYKARPAERILKWMDVTSMTTVKQPTWWIAVIRKKPEKLFSIREESCSHQCSLSESTMYN